MHKFLKERRVLQKADIDLLLLHFLTQCSFILMHSSLEGVAHVMTACCKADAMLLCLTEACDTTQPALSSKTNVTKEGNANQNTCSLCSATAGWLALLEAGGSGLGGTQECAGGSY